MSGARNLFGSAGSDFNTSFSCRALNLISCSSSPPFEGFWELQSRAGLDTSVGRTAGTVSEWDDVSNVSRLDSSEWDDVSNVSRLDSVVEQHLVDRVSA